jgi:hypothetical protein
MITIGLWVTSVCLCGLIVLFPQHSRYVNTLLIYVLAGTALAIFLRIELWPFSPYPMFGNVQGSELKRVRLYGIPVAADQEEIP